ncbi:hypothetical protein PAPYR_10259 [Paratrimastix pyriformis]|uniref:Uncharacterized protein n=1 Tax=Paratrimastix pyriformis TaxID=342808 RepID=A0ABQ8U979_9EUKA|nr:hypothetical protein PAPYR_10259 [Paratrimastix pyriformis]
MGGSAIPLHAYLLLIGLSHATRAAIRGTLREISFVFDHPAGIVPILTADALAAIVGPCKGLVKLTLPERKTAPPKCSTFSTDEEARFDVSLLPLVGCGLTEAACQPWVDAAFAGHSRLAVLHIPWADPLCPAIQLILPHLPGLVELHFLEVAPPHHPALLATLAQSCPGLQSLRLSVGDSPLPECALLGLAGTLKDLAITGRTHPAAVQVLARLAPRLVALERLEVAGDCALEVVRGLPRGACQLTHLALRDLRAPVLDDAHLPCCLESLRILTDDTKLGGPQRGSMTLAARMLVASQATLRSVALDIQTDDPAEYGALLTALNGATSRLAELSLRLDTRDAAPVLAGLPSQLEHIAIDGWCATPVNITRASLRTLRIAFNKAVYLTLACPALETLALSAYSGIALALDCPRLRTIKGLAAVTSLHCLAPMPHLVRADAAVWSGGQSSSSDPHDDRWTNAPPAWLVELAAHAPGLRELVPLCPIEDSLMGTLTRLEGVRLPLPTISLPATLERLDARVSAEAAGRLTVAAPGLHSLRLRSDPAAAPCPLRLTVRCPVLESLALEIPGLTAVAVDGGARLRALRIGRSDGLEGDSLMALLTRHGQRLERVHLPACSASCCAAWPQLATALGRLPRLACLELGAGLPRELALACPNLRQLYLTMDRFPFGDSPARPLVSLQIACPLLEELQGPFDKGLDSLETSPDDQGHRHLRRIGLVKWSSPQQQDLTYRFLGATVETTFKIF